MVVFDFAAEVSFIWAYLNLPARSRFFFKVCFSAEFNTVLVAGVSLPSVNNSHSASPFSKDNVSSDTCLFSLVPKSINPLVKLAFITSPQSVSRALSKAYNALSLIKPTPSLTSKNFSAPIPEKLVHSLRGAEYTQTLSLEV